MIIRWFGLAVIGIALIAAKPAPERYQEIGQFKLGAVFKRAPNPILALKDCANPHDLLSCRLKLDDGIWYSFENNRLVEKLIILNGHNHPWWVNPQDNPVQCRDRLEKNLGFKFKKWTDDYGNIYIESSSLLKNKNSIYYNIVTYYINNKMIYYYETTLPHEDV